MRGHVRRRGKGWVYVVDQGRDDDGRRRQKWSRQYPTRREAEAELRRALGRIDVGKDPLPERVSVERLAGSWRSHMEAQNRPKPQVRRGYLRDVEAHVLPMIGGVEARKVRPAHVQACLDRFAEEHAPRTVQRLRAATSSMFSFAVRMGVCETNPVGATSTPTPSKPVISVPEPDEVRALIDAAVGTELEIPVLLRGGNGVPSLRGARPHVALRRPRWRLGEDREDLAPRRRRPRGRGGHEDRRWGADDPVAREHNRPVEGPQGRPGSAAAGGWQRVDR
jgi:hypothetical protein